jgi:hypothetical protein
MKNKKEEENNKEEEGRTDRGKLKRETGFCRKI